MAEVGGLEPQPVVRAIPISNRLRSPDRFAFLFYWRYGPGSLRETGGPKSRPGAPARARRSSSGALKMPFGTTGGCARAGAPLWRSVFHVGAHQLLGLRPAQVHWRRCLTRWRLSGLARFARLAEEGGVEPLARFRAQNRFQRSSVPHRIFFQNSSTPCARGEVVRMGPTQPISRSTVGGGVAHH